MRLAPARRGYSAKRALRVGRGGDREAPAAGGGLSRGAAERTGRAPPRRHPPGTGGKLVWGRSEGSSDGDGRVQRRASQMGIGGARPGAPHACPGASLAARMGHPLRQPVPFSPGGTGPGDYGPSVAQSHAVSHQTQRGPRSVHADTTRRLGAPPQLPSPRSSIAANGAVQGAMSAWRLQHGDTPAALPATVPLRLQLQTR